MEAGDGILVVKTCFSPVELLVRAVVESYTGKKEFAAIETFISHGPIFRIVPKLRLLLEK